VYRLAIREQDHPQVAPLHLRNLDPAADSTIGLHMLSCRSTNGAFDPFVANHSAIGALTDGSEVRGGLHDRRRWGDRVAA